VSDGAFLSEVGQPIGPAPIGWQPPARPAQRRLRRDNFDASGLQRSGLGELRRSHRNVGGSPGED
jgi:hypothetical protein